MQRHRSLPQLLLLLVLATVGAGLWRWRLDPMVRATAPPVTTETPRPRAPRLRPATAGERRGAVTSITAQLDAFRARDYQRAMLYQSEDLRRSVGSAGQFRRMMEAGYPQFAHYREARFGIALADARGQHLLVPASVTGRDGVTVSAVYLMVLEEGQFRVASVEQDATIEDGPGTVRV